MIPRLLGRFCLLSLALHASALPQPGSAELALGMRQVEDGDLDTAVLTLDTAVRDLRGAPGRKLDLALAHLYLGISYLGLDQVERARTNLREAYLNNREMTLDPKKFSLRVVAAYEDAKAGAASGVASRTPEKGGGKNKSILLVGGLAAAAGGVALSGGGSSSSGSAAPVRGPQVLVSGGSSVSGPNEITRFSSFTVPAAGVIQYTGNWTLATSTFSLELGQNCAGFGPYVAETQPSATRPVTLTQPVSAGGVYCPYAFYVSGTGSESFSYQIVFTAQ
jgi:hypothetical protein